MASTKSKIPSIVQRIQSYVPAKVDYQTQKSVSFSQFSQYTTCKHQWALNYIENQQEYSPSIHTVFGTALHETVQSWLQTVYNESAAAAGRMDLDVLLKDTLRNTYKSEKKKSKQPDFSTPSQMKEFYQDGQDILKYLKSNRIAYFPIKGHYLAGIELPIVYELRKNVYFKGYIDLVIYNEYTNKFLLIDLKTSTSGWNDYQKKDDTKTSQLLLYKHFFSETFDIPIESINLLYMIVRRKINEEYDFVPKRVQKVIPTSGKIKMGQVKKQLAEFIQEAFDQDGKYIRKQYTASPSKSNCKFCPFKDKPDLCAESYKGI